MRLALSCPALAALLLLWSGSAAAARSAYVIGDNGGNVATLKAAPTSGAPPLATLQAGAPVTISNYPTNGYYKARTASGQVGWIATTAVGNTSPAASSSSEEQVPAPPSDEMAAPPPSQNPQQGNEQEPEQENETIPYQDVQSTEGGAIERATPAPTGPRLPLEIKVFGGDQFLLSPISFSQIGAALPSSMLDFGLQAGIPLNNRLFLLLRLEHLGNSSSAASYNFSLSATPVMTGLSYLFTQPGSQVRLRGSLLLGVALATTLDATATSDSSPNVSELETQAFTEMVKFDFDVPVTRRFALYAETGYRFLDSSSVGPSSIVNGSSIFQQGGNTVPMSLNLGGFFLGGGLAFYL